MKLVAYCAECLQRFDNLPDHYWTLYQNVVEELILRGKLYPFITADGSEASAEFISAMEAMELILTCEKGDSRDIVWAKPYHINYVDMKRPQWEVWKVCKDFDGHYACDLDEYLCGE
jgi:hypothetical protein